jgi:hypothetical protein
MKMKKNRWCYLLVFTLLIAFSGNLAAQNIDDVPLPKSLKSGGKADAPDKDRKVKFVVGGYLGFGVGYSVLNLHVSPHVGICPGIDFLCIGVGGTYQLTYYRDPNGYKSFSHVFGFNAFVEGYIWDRLVLHGEYEWLSFPGGTDGRFTSNAVLLGPGYKQNITDKLSVYTHLLFPAYDPENVYPIIDIRVGVNYKF